VQFRLITYNIHKGIGGVDRRYDLDRVAQVISACKADIVFLQEVDDNAGRTNHHRQVDMLASTLQFPHTAFQLNVSKKEGGYGNAILSRYPLSDAHDIDLTIPLKKKRRALVAQCQVENHPVTLCNVHLGLWSIERRIQLKKLIQSGRLPAGDTSRAVVAGDFNDVYGRLGNKTLKPHGYATKGRTRTFPAWMPMMPLDRIYCHGLKIESITKFNTGAAKHASDHLPLLGTISLDAEVNDAEVNDAEVNASAENG